VTYSPWRRNEGSQLLCHCTVEIKTCHIGLRMLLDREIRQTQSRARGQGKRLATGTVWDKVPRVSSTRAVGFIGWLGRVRFIATIAAKNKLRNATKRDCANNCHGANPFPSRRSKWKKAKPVSEGNNSAEDEKRSREQAVNSAAAKSVHQTRYTHECERRCPQNRSQGR